MMNFRKQILLVFFLFGFVPLLFVVAINLPLVLDRSELFYYEAHMQNLRADFRDLDQHIAGRHEIVRLLAKLPEPGVMLGQEQDASGDDIDLARARYAAWINGILRDQQDIIQIIFYGRDGETRFWLERDSQGNGWIPTRQLDGEPAKDFVAAGMGSLYSGEVLVSRILLDSELGHSDPSRTMTMHLISPITTPDQSHAVGAVVVRVDVGGMARYYTDTMWVHNSGRFLDYGSPDAPTGNAFDRFEGLQHIFAEGKTAVWGKRGERVIWLPMFNTESDGPLWVGRSVNQEPLTEFRDTLVWRVLTIVLLLVVVILLVARWFADRADRLSHELTDGIRRVVEEGERVDFVWQGPRELRELGDNLSRLAEQHSRNIAELQQRARELEQSNRFKSQFLANVSHELRTPLNSILLLSRILSSEQSGLSPDLREQARVIHQAGGDLRSLIDNILDLSRNEAGKTSFNLEWFNPEQMLREVVKLVQPQFDEIQIPLHLEVEPEAPRHIYSDSDKVAQILKNFFSNAAKFTQQGEVHVRLRPMSANEECKRCTLAFDVSDTGVGIPRTKQKHIFEAFRQADGSTSRRYGGTGLGLAISRQLANLLGGEILLVSREGEGSTFTLLLPLEFDRSGVDQEQISEPVRAPIADETVPAYEPSLEFVGRNVLVIDDEVESLLALTPLLESWGMQVHAAGDWAEAMDILDEEERIDLVLIDLMMPSIGGCDTIEKIKKKSGRLVTLAMAFSPTALPSDLQAANLIDRIIVKPIDPDELQGLLREYLSS